MDNPQQGTNIYEEQLRYYQEEINQILKQEKAMAELTAKDPEGSMYKKIMLADELIYMVRPYIRSLSILKRLFQTLSMLLFPTMRRKYERSNTYLKNNGFI